MVLTRMSKLSPVETEILVLLWELGEGAVHEVYEKLSDKKLAAYPSVQTLLRRLEKKGYLKHRRQKKAYQYYA